MFDLSAEKLERPFRRQAKGARSISVALHVVVSALVVGVPLLTATDALPEVAAMKIFMSAPPAPPPPPPPPPAPAEKPRPKPAEKPVSSRFAAPIEAPSVLLAEPIDYASQEGEGEFEGVEGGVIGGVAGGVLGGVIGGLLHAAPAPPPPPPAAPLPKQPVRIGGQITSPAILKRVEPKYPDIAAAAKLSGLVILEALVDESGAVQTVKVLRAPSVFLERAAVEALKEWRYSPLVLDGVPMAFVLTVTFNFSVK
jgi:protein TonB